MFTSGGGDPQSPRTGQRPGTAARVLRGVGTERQPVVGRPVRTRRTLPHPADLWTRGEGGAAAVLVAAQLAVADPAEAGDQSGWRSARGSSRELTRDGIAASDGPPPAGAIVLAPAADSSGDAHLTVLAGTPGGQLRPGPVGQGPGYEQTHWAALIWTRPLRAGIADYRFIKVLSAVSHGMSTYPGPNGCETAVSSSR